jgi:hypothetical protein
VLVLAVWNVNLYSKGVTEASKSVLLEVLRILGSYKNYIVLSGGWTPYFILQRFGEADQHCGSIDIDFVLDPGLIDLRVYETIVSMIEKRGYEPYKTKNDEILPYRFYRSIRSPLDGLDYDIEVDFITEPRVVEKLHPSMFLAVQRDLQAVIIRGSNIVFSHNFEHTIKGTLPSGAETRVTCKIADVTGCIAMKGLALKGRYKEKDPYDIYFLLRHYREDPEKAAKEVRRYLEKPIVREAVDEIKEKFRTPRSEGPFQVGYFLAPEDEMMRERIQGEAFTTLRMFLEELT